MPECSHGEMIPKVGRSARTKHHWAGWFCPERVSDCDPEWMTEGEVFDYWLESVSAEGNAGDEPPF